MENIETLLAAVAQTQGFDDDEPVAASSKLVKLEPSPEIPKDAAVVGDPPKDSPPVANPPPETTVAAAAAVGSEVTPVVVKRKRGRPPKGQTAAKPPPAKRKKQQQKKEEKEKEKEKEKEEEEDEEDGEDVCFICFDGGSLVLCDRKGCPKAYHPSCIKREEAFFKSKAKWNCGWHICSVCRKTSYYMCYTCPYSLCKLCTKDEEFVRVRGNKGFCTTCMKTIMMIENNGTSKDSPIQVDFDDKTSWEYLFKAYWVTLKEEFSLTMKDLTHAKKPWKCAVSVVSRPQLNYVCHTVVNGNVPITPKTEPLEMSKLQEAPYDRLNTAHSTIDNHVEKLNHNCSQDGQILSSGSKNNNSNRPTIVAEPGTIKQVSVKAGDNLSIEDAAQPGTTAKLHVDHIEMPKLPQSHVGSLESDMEVNGNNLDQSAGSKNRNLDTFKMHEERATQNDLRKYAAIDVHNMNLIYLRRNLMENLIEDKQNFQDNVVGSIVRIRISSDDHKPDVYRLVQVVGICKASKPYKIGDKTIDVMLEVLNLGKKEIVSVDAISNQEFVEAECRQLDQYIRCGLLKQYTLDEVRKKAMAFQSVRFDNWLEAELMRLYHLLDQASKKGCEEEVSEYVRKIQVLKLPEERQLRISKVPEIHSDAESVPNNNSEAAKSSGNNTKGEHVSPRQSVSPVITHEHVSPRQSVSPLITHEHVSPRQSVCPLITHEHVSPRQSVSPLITHDHVSPRQSVSPLITHEHVSPRQSVSPLSEKKSVSPKERGKEEGPVVAQSKLIEAIDASGSHDLEKCMNQVNTTNAAVAGGHDQAMVRSELETSTATVSVVNSLTDDNIEIEKLWHYRDPNGKIQGPFSMMHLRQWSTTGQFPPEMRIWTNHENFDSLLFTDALNGKFHGASELPHNLSSGSRGIKENEAIKMSNADIKQADATRCNNNNSSVLSENDSGNKMADESSWPKCWDLFKDKSSNANDVPGYSLIPPSSPVQMPEATAVVRECDETNHVTKNAEKSSSVPIQNDATGAYELHNKSTQQCVARQPSEEKLGPLPIGLSLNDIEPVPIPEPVSKSPLPKPIKAEADFDVSFLPSPKPWGIPTAERHQSEPSNISIQNMGFLELLSPKPRSDNDDMEIQVEETKQSGPVHFHVPNVDPSWSSALNMVVGGMRLPDVANEWCGYSNGLISASSSKPPEITSDNVVAPEINHFSPPHPTPTMSSWLAMINEPIEFDALGEESVSDLLAEVDAMESQGAMPSPTSAMKFAKELIQDGKDDCFSSIEDFDPGKSDALSSTGEIQLNHPSSIPFKPIAPCLIDAFDSFSKSGVHSSGSSAGETNMPVYEASSEFHRPAPNLNHEMVGAALGPETSDPGWGNVQGNINLVTVQGNVNLVLGGHAQGMTDLGWGTNQPTTWGNPNINHSPRNGSLPWDPQRKYIGERERFTNGREWGYPGVDPGFGRGRPPWGRPPYGGVQGGGGGRPLPKGQRICKFYESGRCKKGAFCDYLHP